MTRKKVVVFISGTGSNMEALINAARQEDFPATIVAVFSDQADAKGILKSKALNVPVQTIIRQNFASKQQFEAAILDWLSHYDPDIICLAGYMKLISPYFLEAYKGVIFNIHPSLLPLFPGLDTYQRALNTGMKIAGCSVHLVTEQVDSGLIIAQAAVPIYQNDNKETLAQRILMAEHQLYPAALKYFITGVKSCFPDQNILYSYG